MAGRRTNLALLALLSLALLTGGLAYAFGASWARAVVIAHGIAGLAIVLLSPWKSLVARRGLRRRRSGRAASIALSTLVVVALLTGIGHSTGALRSLGPVTAMQVHVGAALIALPLAIWHVVARPQRLRRTDLSRRQLVRAGAVLGGAGIAYAAIEGLMRVARLPGRDRRFTGSFERGSFEPEMMPVTQWLDDDVPRLSTESWELIVSGEASERAYRYDELASFTDSLRATLDCTGGWYAEQDWTGVRLDRLVREEGRSISVTSATGYGRLFPIEDASRMLLATRVAGRTLSAGHGFPARLVVPGRRGFWWVKWVVRIETDDRPWWAQWPFPPT